MVFNEACIAGLRAAQELSGKRFQVINWGFLIGKEP